MVGDFAIGVLDEGELLLEGFGAGPIAEDGFYLGEDCAVVGGFFFGDGLGEFADGIDILGASFAVDARVAWDEGGQLRWDGGVGFGGFGHGWGVGEIGDLKVKFLARYPWGRLCTQETGESKEDKRQIAPSLREQASLALPTNDGKMQ